MKSILSIKRFGLDMLVALFSPNVMVFNAVPIHKATTANTKQAVVQKYFKY